MPATATYEPFDLPNEVAPPDSSRTSVSMTDNFPLAADVIAAALGVALENWETEAADLTHEEVTSRLAAAQLGGLTEAVWQGILQARENARSATPVLGESALPRERATPTMARSPRVSAARDDGETLVSLHPYTSLPHMHGRVPRSEETWQWAEGEYGCMGSVRAVRRLAAHERAHAVSTASSDARVCASCRSTPAADSPHHDQHPRHRHTFHAGEDMRPGPRGVLPPCSRSATRARRRVIGCQAPPC